jgi:hypothetical protein
LRQCAAVEWIPDSAALHPGYLLFAAYQQLCRGIQDLRQGLHELGRPSQEIGAKSEEL